MAFVLPTFNISVNIHDALPTPPAGASRLTLNGQLRAPAMNNTGVVPAINAISTIILLLPKGTDIRDPWVTPINNADFVEAPAGTGRWYRVVLVDDVGRGFPNEHRYAILQKVFGVPWPQPIP